MEKREKVVGRGKRGKHRWRWRGRREGEREREKSEEEGKRKHSGERKAGKLWFLYTVCPSYTHELKAWSKARGSNH